jgi:hypothetical protein
VEPAGLVIVADATFFGRAYGFLIFKAPEVKKNLYVNALMYESIYQYQLGRITIENKGIRIKAIVLDGKPGIRNLFSDIPVQMCHFHQKQIIQKYLTLKPKLEAGIELKAITDTLTSTNEKEFSNNITNWYEKWESFLKEKTTDPVTGKWHYTHPRVRSAHRSLRINLPYLFTYLNYPKLNIPNTTNSLEGSFSHLKEKVGIHRGLKVTIKYKMIEEILHN